MITDIFSPPLKIINYYADVPPQPRLHPTLVPPCLEATLQVRIDLYTPKGVKFNPYPPMVHYGYPVKETTVKRIANEHQLHGYAYKTDEDMKDKKVWDLRETARKVAYHITNEFGLGPGGLKLTAIERLKLKSGKEFWFLFSFATNYDI